jgi:predicted dehydrogenase
MAAKRILMIGAGGIGLKHIRFFSSLEEPPRLSVLDPNPESTAKASELGAEILQTGWDSIDLSDFDGAIICAPAPFHIPYASRCLNEGLPVLSEKPLSHTWDGVEGIVDLAGQVRTPSGVAYVRRYHPVHERASEFLSGGGLGEILDVKVFGGQPYYQYRPDYRKIYYASHAMGGGCLLDCASHMVDLVQYYLGPADTMSGRIRHLALEGVEVEDTVSLSLDFRAGALGTMHINQFQPANETCIEFAGMGGVLRIIEPAFTCMIWRKGSESWEDLPTEPGDVAEAFRRQAKAFLDVIDGGPPMRTSFADAAGTLRLCLDVMSDE